MAGSYVDWVGSSGAMPVIIPFDLPKHTLDTILANIDGMLLPGGAADLKKKDDETETTNYQKSIDYITKWAMKRNDEGHYFPVMGTCLGYENFLITFAEDTSALECNMPDFSVAHTVQVLPAFDNSKFWTRVGIDLAKQVFSTESTYFTHLCGLRPEHFLQNSKLSSSFNLLATSKTREGIEFVSSIEHKKYPFIANQFHPEKNLYNGEDLYDFMDRNRPALGLSQKICSKFVQMIRENGKPRESKDLNRIVKRYLTSQKIPETILSSFYSRLYVYKRITKGD